MSYILNFEWLSGIDVDHAKYIFLTLFVLIAVVILNIPNAYIYEGIDDNDRHWYMNLKLWALIALGSIFYTYWIF